MTPQTISIIGLGYIGLPLASLLAAEGKTVLGVDSDPRVVKTLQDGHIHIVEPGLHALVSAGVGSGHFRVSTTPEPSDYFVICVPTPFKEGHQADLSYVERAAQSLVPHLRPGCTVILESTVPVGTTETCLRPILEKSGLEVGQTLFMAYCPERVLPGRILKELVENDRVIGGIDAPSTQKAKSLYATFVNGELHETHASTAEMVKLVENSYRDVNIAFANELATISSASGLNVWEVIRLANKHPRVKILSPGPGVGGHCIAVDPWFIVEKAGENARLIRTAREVNDGRPEKIVAQVRRAVEDIPNPKIACLGLTYKANVDDTRESPAAQVALGLVRAGFQVMSHDPFVTTYKGLELASLDETLRQAHAAVLLVDHKEFSQLDWAKALKLMARPRVIDTRGVVPVFVTPSTHAQPAHS